MFVLTKLHISNFKKVFLVLAFNTLGYPNKEIFQISFATLQNWVLPKYHLAYYFCHFPCICVSFDYLDTNRSNCDKLNTENFLSVGMDAVLLQTLWFKVVRQQDSHINTSCSPFTTSYWLIFTVLDCVFNLGSTVSETRLTSNFLSSSLAVT